MPYVRVGSKLHDIIERAKSVNKTSSRWGKPKKTGKWRIGHRRLFDHRKHDQCGEPTSNQSACLEHRKRLIEHNWENTKIKTNEVVSMRFQETDALTLRAGTLVFREHRPLLDYVVIFMIRKPLNMVLSGYNYHAEGKERMWTDQTLWKTQTVNHNDYPLMECFRNVWNPEEYVINDGPETTRN